MITATKSGTEKNATVFARYWAEALRDPAADTDKNDAVSALEAFRYAQRKVTDSSTTQKRLATEHAVLEDTGKGEGENATLGRERRRQAGRGLHAGAPGRQRRGGARSRQARRCWRRRSSWSRPSTS